MLPIPEDWRDEDFTPTTSIPHNLPIVQTTVPIPAHPGSLQEMSQGRYPQQLNQQRQALFVDGQQLPQTQSVNQRRPGQSAGTGYLPSQIVRHSPQIQNVGLHQINQLQGNECIHEQRAVNRGNPSLQTLPLPQQRYVDQNNWREQHTFGHHQQQSIIHPPQHPELRHMILPFQNMYIQQQYQSGNVSHLNTLTSNPGFLNFGQQMQPFPTQQTVFPSPTRTDQNTRAQYSQFSRFDRPLVPPRFKQSQRARFQPPTSHQTYIPYPAYSAPPVPRIPPPSQNFSQSALPGQQFRPPWNTYRHSLPSHAGQNQIHQVAPHMSDVTQHDQPGNAYYVPQTLTTVYSNPAAIWNTHQSGASPIVHLPHMSNTENLNAPHPAQRVSFHRINQHRQATPSQTNNIRLSEGQSTNISPNLPRGDHGQSGSPFSRSAPPGFDRTRPRSESPSEIVCVAHSTLSSPDHKVR